MPHFQSAAHLNAQRQSKNISFTILDSCRNLKGEILKLTGKLRLHDAVYNCLALGTMIFLGEILICASEAIAKTDAGC